MTGFREDGDATIEWRRDRMSPREFHQKLVMVALAGPVAEMLYRGEPLHPEHGGPARFLERFWADENRHRKKWMRGLNILGMAAHLEGKGVGVLDMAGLAQKGGAVYSHMRIAEHPEDIHAIRILAMEPTTDRKGADSGRRFAGWRGEQDPHSRLSGGYAWRTIRCTI